MLRAAVRLPSRLTSASSFVHRTFAARAASAAINHAKIHEQLNKHENICGVHGGDHAVYHAVAEAKTSKPLERLRGGHFKPSDEWKVPALLKHFSDPKVQARWKTITTLDPYGMDSSRPTISATPACMEIPELTLKLRRDDKIVNADGSINCVKIAIDPVWNLPAIAAKLGVEESYLRDRLSTWTQNETIRDAKNNLFLPSIGGTTVYVIGDLAAITDPSRKVAVRTHDECNGSDVFGTDICTCRPYLVYAIKGAVETAQQGGCGIIAYYRKEGRALGEVTKFRVYNSRKYQDGGDRPETYFAQTANIAGIVDARAQEFMPDVLLFLGIDRIDTLLSMSKDKYEAITGAGIKVVVRDSLPEEMVPKNAQVEIEAKISSGYAGFKPTVPVKSMAKLWELNTIRERCKRMLEIGANDKLPNFRVDLAKVEHVVTRVVDTMAKAYPRGHMTIPYHARMRHFETGAVNRVSQLERQWREERVNSLEVTRRLIDLVVSSVLLDAGAGATWTYRDMVSAGGKKFTRSEGLGIASFEMFRNGLFSADNNTQCVDARGLARLTEEDLAGGFQITSTNKIVGLAGRTNLLKRLGASLEKNAQIFSGPTGELRPGHLLDYLLGHTIDSTTGTKRVSVRVLWKAVVDGFGDVFPDPTGKQLGDTWPHRALGDVNSLDSHVPFHKLAQWLTYSLIEPLEDFGIKFVDTWLLTGLAEYRNGGLFVDTGVIVPRKLSELDVTHKVSDEIIVEWRALTVALLDNVATGIYNRIGVTQQQLPLSKVLEGGTWRAGRGIAWEKRPTTGDPPLRLESTGDTF